MALVPKIEKKYSYTDYVTWPDDERWEIIDGKAYDMSPAPTTKHQKISGNIYYALRLGFTRNEIKCSIFNAPTDVVFDEYNIVQPDIFVVCDKTKITEQNIQGAPDLIIEVLSPSTSSKDRRDKKILYERFGVKEYMLVYPEYENVERYVLKDGEYGKPEIFNWDEIQSFHPFDIEINLWEIFELEAPEQAV